MPRDPGLQPERTALAWQRTGVAGTALAATAALAAAHLEHRSVLIAVTSVAVLSVVAVAVAASSVRSSGSGEGVGQVRGSPWVRLLAVGAIPVLLAAAGALMAALPR